MRRFGEKNWKGIAALVGSRDHVQCRQRWQKVLRPVPLTSVGADLVVGRPNPNTGPDCAFQRVPRRPCAALLRRLSAAAVAVAHDRATLARRPGLRKGQWSDEEDKTLLDMYMRQGIKDWKLICVHIPGPSDPPMRPFPAFV